MSKDKHFKQPVASRGEESYFFVCSQVETDYLCFYEESLCLICDGWSSYKGMVQGNKKSVIKDGVKMVRFSDLLDFLKMIFS